MEKMVVVARHLHNNFCTEHSAPLDQDSVGRALVMLANPGSQHIDQEEERRTMCNHVLHVGKVKWRENLRGRKTTPSKCEYCFLIGPEQGCQRSLCKEWDCGPLSALAPPMGTAWQGPTGKQHGTPLLVPHILSASGLRMVPTATNVRKGRDCQISCNTHPQLNT
jgi:hypothetical protein